jgi:hypothetical protein
MRAGVDSNGRVRPAFLLMDDGVKAVDHQLDGRRCRSTFATSIVEARR